MNGMQHMGAAPPGGDPLGWVIALGGTMATLWVIALAVRLLITPGETAPDHPKLLILKDDR
ncbi:MAG: hypothetical protein DLM53_07815 [Candidatus Eremiobacter antarcticus]|nr:MAG: hypothetical protein DLM53_07815 [Candidatus Eremiobacter sp. RRmetagenome_bin22]